jgi:predicted O-methyltransferase YrrM
VSAAARLRYLGELSRLPPRVAAFHARARRAARAGGDEFSLASATRPADVAILLEVAAGQRAVVELGTGTGWTAIALALADRRRRVLSYDPVVRPERERYLRLAGRRARRRIELVAEPGDRGPPSGHPPTELLFIDSSHEREQTVREFQAWRGALAPGAVVVFDDYATPAYPGVREAVAQLGLDGETRGMLFLHRLPERAATPPPR